MSYPYAGAPPWADPQQQGTPWQTSPSDRSHGIAVTALVLSCLALLFGLVMLLVLVFGGSSPTLHGTAPQVLPGRPYPGPRLEAEVSAVLRDQGYDVSTLTCPATRVVEPGVRTTCTGRVDGGRERVVVAFTDTAGHFTLAES